MADNGKGCCTQKKCDCGAKGADQLCTCVKSKSGGCPCGQQCKCGANCKCTSNAEKAQLECPCTPGKCTCPPGQCQCASKDKNNVACTNCKCAGNKNDASCEAKSKNGKCCC